MARIDFDWSQLNQLGAELSGAPDRAQVKVFATTTRAALNVKNNSRKLVRGQMSGRGKTYIPHYPRAIDYEIEKSGGEISADIGPRSDMPQGGMGAAIEFGGSRAAPMPHLVPAFEQEIPTWMTWLADAAFESVLP